MALVPAVGLILDQDFAEVAWRSGRMVGFLRNALEHGGIWIRHAQAWLADRNASVWDLDEPEFERELRSLLQPGSRVMAVLSPATNSWVLIPKD
jgi:hypothetical protein